MAYSNEIEWFEYNEPTQSEKQKTIAKEFNRIFADLLTKHKIEPIKIIENE